MSLPFTADTDSGLSGTGYYGWRIDKRLEEWMESSNAIVVNSPSPVNLGFPRTASTRSLTIVAYYLHYEE